MSQAQVLPSIETIPDDIDDQLRHLIHNAPELVTEEWLCELIKNSGHLTTPDYLRWRVVGLIWLAAEFDIEKAWPYLMWFNMGEPTISDHLNEIITDGVDEMQCHVQLANWISKAPDEGLITFFSTYKNIPLPHKMAPLLRRLMTNPQAPETGVWLVSFCRDTADKPSPRMRPWHLLGVIWYATCFNPAAGLTYLRQLSDGHETLSAEDNQLLAEAAHEINAAPALIQWIAACPDPAVRTMLKDFGHPDLADFTNKIFEHPPDYEHLAKATAHAAGDVQTFERNRNLLEQAGISRKTAKILDLACGPLAPQTVLLSSVGYRVMGVDLHIPPGYLSPLSLKQRLKKGKYVKAWKTVAAPYYEALARHAGGLKLKWNKVTIKLVDLSRLNIPDDSFDGVICCNYLHRAPDVDGLLAEAARVLKPGGLFLADIKPYLTLSGGFHPANSASPWSHVREKSSDIPGTAGTLNRWREGEYRAFFEKYFTLEQWLAEQDEAAIALLTPEIQAELADYSAEELTRKQIVVVARKKV